MAIDDMFKGIKRDLGRRFRGEREDERRYRDDERRYRDDPYCLQNIFQR